MIANRNRPKSPAKAACDPIGVRLENRIIFWLHWGAHFGWVQSQVKAGLPKPETPV